MNKPRIFHAHKDKPFRPAGMEALFGWLSTLQRTQAKGIQAQQESSKASYLPPVLRFRLAKTDYSLYTLTSLGKPNLYSIWDWRKQAFVVYNEPVENLFGWLSQTCKQQDQTKGQTHTISN